MIFFFDVSHRLIYVPSIAKRLTCLLRVITSLTNRRLPTCAVLCCGVQEGAGTRAVLMALVFERWEERLELGNIWYLFFFFGGEIGV